MGEGEVPDIPVTGRTSSFRAATINVNAEYSEGPRVGQS